MQFSLRDAILLACTLSVRLVDASMAGFSCDMTRTTGYADHRTLNLPAALWDSASYADRAWAEKLCCVFTWVARDSSTTTPYMITFDGGRRNYQDATTFAAAAESVYSAVCGMSMGSQDCATETQRCPVTRNYEAVGQLCRPKNNDGYAISTQVVSASACRDKCEADASRCGAFEYEYVAGDDRECELHEKGWVDRAATAAMGTCLLTTVGGDAMLDPPVLGQYRCCWVVNGAAAAATTTATSVSSTAAATTTTSFTVALVSLSLAYSTQQERSSTATTTNARFTTSISSSSSFPVACKNVALLVVLVVCFCF